MQNMSAGILPLEQVIDLLKIATVISLTVPKTKNPSRQVRKGIISFFVAYTKLMHRTTISHRAAIHLVEDAIRLLPFLPFLFM